MNNIEIKRLICSGFCDGLEVSESGSLLNVSVPFELASGDPLSFYVVPVGENQFRLEDDGGFVPYLIASGINLLEGQRNREFQRILDLCGMQYNSSTGELVSQKTAADGISTATLNFINAVMKIDSLRSPLRPESVASMFVADARSKISESFGGRASLLYDQPVSATLTDFIPDVIIQPHEGRLAAIYFLTSDQKAWEAIALRYKAVHEERLDCAVISLFDRVGSALVNRRSVASVSHNLDANPYFYDGPDAAMGRIAEVINSGSAVVH